MSIKLLAVLALAAYDVAATGVNICFRPSDCENGSFKSHRDKIIRKCTCDADWSGSCCTVFTGKCTIDMEHLCPQDSIEEKSSNIADFLGDDNKYAGPLTIGTADDNLPVTMQGIFWLQGLEESSSVISFGRSRDGDGISIWKDSSIKVRVAGDRVWSFASRTLVWNVVKTLDLVYDFRGNDELDPTHFDIIPQTANGLSLDDTIFKNALKFDMDFIPVGDAKHEYPAADGRPAAVQWARPSEILGQERPDGYYQVAQVIDGDGNPTSAYDSWVEYNEANGVDIWADSVIHWHTAK